MTMQMFKQPDLLAGQTALVTGGTAGIGKQIAIQLALSGAKVAIFGTNAERGAQVVEEIRQLTNQDAASFFAVNIADTEAVDQTIKKVYDTFGKLDCLINNAGITRDQLLMKMSEGEWDAVLDTNIKGCYNTCHSVVRAMMKARRGSIINMSSVVGLTGNAGQVNYAASKAAVIGFTKALAKELATRQIRVNCVCPGFIETSMTEVLTEAQKEAVLAQIPLGRMGMPSEIANMVLFLASDFASYITGQVFVVDGGMTT